MYRKEQLLVCRPSDANLNPNRFAGSYESNMEYVGLRMFASNFRLWGAPPPRVSYIDPGLRVLASPFFPSSMGQMAQQNDRYSTWVASLMTESPPQKKNHVLLDYKGFI
jgi:hypothetical protein